VLEERLEMDGDKVGADGDTGECVLQCVAVCCSEMDGHKVDSDGDTGECVLQRVVACDSVLQRVATCCSVTQVNLRTSYPYMTCLIHV